MIFTPICYVKCIRLSHIALDKLMRIQNIRFNGEMKIWRNEKISILITLISHVISPYNMGNEEDL